MSIPADLKFAESHEWIRVEGDVATVGISDHAQSELTDIVFAEPPQAGRKATAKETIAIVESVKAASDIYSPVSGEVIEGNSALDSNPSLLNTDPYGEGWIYKIKLSDPAELDALKTAEQYQQQIS